jgi:hypothetical protein
VVAADKMNVLYIGIENPMSIAAENYSCKDLVVEISQGTITKDEDYSCRHIAKVTTPGKATIIIKNKNGKILEEAEFRVKRVPDPIAMVAGMNGGVIGKSKFKVQMGIVAVLLNFDIDIRYKIISYDVISFNTRKNTFFFETNLGALFNERVKEKIMNVETDDIFLFDKIKVAGPDGITRELSPITFRINDSEINSPESR